MFIVTVAIQTRYAHLLVSFFRTMCAQTHAKLWRRFQTRQIKTTTTTKTTKKKRIEMKITPTIKKWDHIVTCVLHLPFKWKIISNYDDCGTFISIDDVSYFSREFCARIFFVCVCDCASAESVITYQVSRTWNAIESTKCCFYFPILSYYRRQTFHWFHHAFLPWCKVIAICDATTSAAFCALHIRHSQTIPAKSINNTDNIHVHLPFVLAKHISFQWRIPLDPKICIWTK